MLHNSTKGKIQTKIIHIDLIRGNTLELYTDILNEIKDLDIAILVNNGPQTKYEYFR